MWRVVQVAVAFLLACGLVACGGGIFVGTGGQNTTVVTTSGTVSIVQLTIIDGDVQVTVVTLINNGFATTTNFCGNVVNQFPMNGVVTVNFTQGVSCATPVEIIRSSRISGL